MVIAPGSRVTTDTYFGRFPASYWQRWTVVDQMEVELLATGSGTVTLIVSDSAGDTRIVTAHELDGADHASVKFTQRLDKYLDGGSFWLDISTGDDAELVIEQLRWTVAPPAELRPTAIVICTFNRADDCVNTLQSLAADPDTLDVLDAVYVVDQGTDTVMSRPGFPDVEKALDGRLRYLQQPNLGGAGGFTRGLYEVTEVSHGEHANVLFMDDDVVLDPEIAIRMTAFANRTSEPTIVGGQMLRLLHPTTLFAGAEYADFPNLTPGKVVDNALDDADLLGEEEDEDGIPTGRLNRGDRRVDADYNAWWSCLIPAEIVAAIGYPLPLFFQWDDVEYGYRARNNGYATVTLPGAGLWHLDFDWKDVDKWGEYFAIRNAMIVATLQPGFDPRRTARSLVARITRSLVSMRYGLAATVIKAIEDYLEGPRILADGGVQAAAEIRKLRAEYPDTVLHAPLDVPGLGAGQRPMVQAGPTPSLNRLVLLKRLVYLMLGKTVHEIGSVPYADAKWWHLSQFKTAVVTDASQDGVRVLHRDREMVLQLTKRGGKAIRRLMAESAQVKASYLAAVPELTSRKNWERLFDS
jgi:galactofuranosylgalactofuranosylrhamnosyl-N-acetylglucosaminyl-diphospho-decaprenol beta-1,5/1,6-galactofuranosyltransferase